MALFLGPAWAPNGEPFLVEKADPRRYPAHREKQKTREVIDDYGNAVCYLRRCSSCLRWRPLQLGVFAASASKRLGMQSACVECQVVGRRLKYRANPERERDRQRERRRRLMQDPAWVERDRELNRQRIARYKEEDYERFRQMDRARQKRYRDKLKGDPERLARFRESERMQFRLRRERRTGVHISQMRKVSTAMRPNDIPYKTSLPGPALAAAIRQAVPEGDVLTFCDSVGVSDRAVRRWEAGEGCGITSADTILTRLDLCWWEVWTEGDEYERARQVWEGDEEAAA